MTSHSYSEKIRSSLSFKLYELMNYISNKSAKIFVIDKARCSLPKKMKKAVARSTASSSRRRISHPTSATYAMFWLKSSLLEKSALLSHHES